MCLRRNDDAGEVVEAAEPPGPRRGVPGLSRLVPIVPADIHTRLYLAHPPSPEQVELGSGVRIADGKVMAISLLRVRPG